MERTKAQGSKYEGQLRKRMALIFHKLDDIHRCFRDLDMRRCKAVSERAAEDILRPYASNLLLKDVTWLITRFSSDGFFRSGKLQAESSQRIGVVAICRFSHVHISPVAMNLSANTDLKNSLRGVSLRRRLLKICSRLNYWGRSRPLLIIQCLCG